MALPVLRISRGSFAASDYARARTRLDEAQRSLVPAIQQLRGCLHYWAGVDAASNTMVNVSVWASLTTHAASSRISRTCAEPSMGLGL
jgi:quinol monooxygenase YgiN